MHSVIIAAISVTIAALSGAGFGSSVEESLLLLAVGVALIGVPHGALDPIAGQRLFSHLANAWWVAFFGLYLALSLVVVCGWYIAPVVTCLLFFAFSAWHFGLEEDYARPTNSLLSRHLFALARGSLIILVISIFRPDETLSILAKVMPSGSAQQAATVMSSVQLASFAIIPLAVLDFVGWIRSAKTGRMSVTSRMLSVGLLAMVVNPLLSFNVYFCGWHSARGLRELRMKVGGSFGEFVLRLNPLNYGNDSSRSIGVCSLVAVGSAHVEHAPHDFYGAERHRNSASPTPHNLSLGVQLVDGPSQRARIGAMQLNGNREFDYILAGGGLQAGLLVLAIRHYQPNARILVVERGTSFGGNHTWSFHRRDISPAVQDWLSSLPTHSWNSYLVRFPGYERMVDLEYNSTTSQMLAGFVWQRLLDDQGRGSQLLLTSEVSNICSDTIKTGDGERFGARCVIDCRGQRRPSLGNQDAGAPVCGYQKFYGVEIELDDDWPSSVPMLMDACVDQGDGFHFVYVLPFTPRRVLVEDTWFSNSPSVDLDASAKHLRSYIEKNTKSKWNTIRFERGCLPMPLQGLAPEPAPRPNTPLLLAGGYAGGWFHAATGYSFPLAAQFANAIATVAPEQAQESIERLRQSNEFRFRFSRFLNRLLFRLVKPQSRWQIFRRLYRSVPQETLSRFYAHEFSAADAVRMIVGVPPSGLTPLRFIRGMRDDRRISRSHPLENSA